MDLSTLSDDELIALNSGDLSKVSDDTLKSMNATPDKGFVENISDDLGERAQEIKKIQGGGYDQNLASDVLQIGGQTAGAALDVGENAVKGIYNAIPEKFTNPIEEKLQQGADWAMEQPIMKDRVVPNIQNQLQYVSKLAQENPEAARNLGAIAEIGGAIPTVRGAKGAAKASMGGAKAVNKYVSTPDMDIGILEKAKNTSYKSTFDKAEKAGTLIQTNDIRSRFNSGLNEALTNTRKKLDPKKTPEAFNVQKEVNDFLGGKTVTPAELEDLRESINTSIDLVQSTGKLGKTSPDEAMLYTIKNKLDDAVNKIDDKEFFKGSREFIEDYANTRKIAKSYYDAKIIDKIFRDAQWQKRGATSDAKDRVQTALIALVKNDNKMASLSPEVQFAVKKAAQSGKIENLAVGFGRAVNPFTFSGKVALPSVIAGSAALNPAIAAAIPLGVASGAGANAFRSNLNNKVMKSVFNQFDPSLTQSPLVNDIKSLTDRAKNAFTAPQGK